MFSNHAFKSFNFNSVNNMHFTNLIQYCNHCMYVCILLITLKFTLLSMSNIVMVEINALNNNYYTGNDFANDLAWSLIWLNVSQLVTELGSLFQIRIASFRHVR